MGWRDTEITQKARIACGRRPSFPEPANFDKRRVPIDIATQIAEHVADDALSEREIEVLRCLAAGNYNKLIAIELGIGEETVKAHMKSILPKLDASDRTHAVVIALRRGILDI